VPSSVQKQTLSEEHERIAEQPIRQVCEL